MLFTSRGFLLLIALLLPAYYLLPRRWQPALLFLANLIFYALSGAAGLLYLAASAVSVWFCALRISRSYEESARFRRSEEWKTMPKDARKKIARKQERTRKLWLIAALAVNAGMLAVVKYTGFVLSCFGLSGAAEFFVPLGLSFYTFRAISYVLDVYRETAEAERSLPRFGLYLSFFPLVLQGPITRYGDVRDALAAPHPAEFRTICFGLQRVVWGYFKKLVVADRLLPVVSAICGDPEQYTGAYVLLGALLYAAQLYADFTGGIDITIGLSEALGIPVAENFIRPFFSQTVAEYWRRWHITMGSWFRDYIFYPVSVNPLLLRLAGKVKKKAPALGKKLPVYTATMITWFLTGLWHGAAWNFVVWGLLNGVIILIAEETKPLGAALARRFPRLTSSRGWKIFRILRTFFILCALRLLDCYGNVRTAFRAFFSVFTGVYGGSLVLPGFSLAGGCIAGAGVLLMFAVSLTQERRGSVREWLWTREILSHGLFFLLTVVILVFGAYGTGYDAASFIYSRY